LVKDHQGLGQRADAQCLNAKYNTRITARKKRTVNVMINGHMETGGGAGASILGIFGAGGAFILGTGGGASLGGGGIFGSGGGAAAGILGIAGAARCAPVAAGAGPGAASSSSTRFGREMICV
jgi:hypothetical protein